MDGVGEEHEMIRRGPELQIGDLGPPKEGNKIKQYFAGFCATLGAFAAGTVIGWTAPTLPLLQAANSSLPITEEQGSWIGAVMPIGAFVGAIPAGLLADAVGRKTSVALLSAPFMLSWVLIIFASNVAMLYAARFIAGMATGATSVAATTYVAEIAETSVKGTLGAFFQLQVTIGILFTFGVGAVASYSALAVACGVVPVLWLATVLLLPETPVYLLQKRRATDAERSLRWLRGPSYDVKRELNHLQRAVDEAARNKASVKDLFQSRAALKALIICLGLMVFQQITGINAITFNTVSIFEAAGSSLPGAVASIIVAVVQVVVTGITAAVVDKAGRRVLLLMSAVVMAIMHCILGVYFYLKESGTDVSGISWLPLICVTMFIVVFSLGFGPIPWMMAGELFTSSLSAPASSLAAAVNWLSAFIVTKVFQNLLDSLGIPGTYWLFSGCAVAAFLFVLVLVFETKGKDSDEIQAILAGKPSATSNRNGRA